MSNDFDARLRRLEGEYIPLQNMQQDLYTDYLKLSQMVDEAEHRVADARIAEVDIHKRLKMIRESYEREEAAMLATDERAGGKKDTERKRNANNLILQEKAEGGKLHGFWIAFVDAEHEYEMATADKESAVGSFSAVRYIMRMASGLAHSLGA